MFLRAEIRRRDISPQDIIRWLPTLAPRQSTYPSTLTADRSGKDPAEVGRQR